jgi:hypothetical protein
VVARWSANPLGMLWPETDAALWGCDDDGGGPKPFKSATNKGAMIRQNGRTTLARPIGIEWKILQVQRLGKLAPDPLPIDDHAIWGNLNEGRRRPGSLPVGQLHPRMPDFVQPADDFTRAIVGQPWIAPAQLEENVGLEVLLGAADVIDVQNEHAHANFCRTRILHRTTDVGSNQRR